MEVLDVKGAFTLQDSHVTAGNLSNPLPVGSTEQFVVTLGYAHYYYLAVIVIDNKHNKSPPSNVVEVVLPTTTPQPTTSTMMSSSKDSQQNSMSKGCQMRVSMPELIFLVMLYATGFTYYI